MVSATVCSSHLKAHDADPVPITILPCFDLSTATPPIPSCRSPHLLSCTSCFSLEPRDTWNGKKTAVAKLEPYWENPWGESRRRVPWPDIGAGRRTRRIDLGEASKRRDQLLLIEGRGRGRGHGGQEWRGGEGTSKHQLEVSCYISR
eukprot:751541-Hanusia_phi.AAC.1